MKNGKRLLALVMVLLCLCLPGCKEKTVKPSEKTPESAPEAMTAAEVYWEMRAKTNGQKASSYTEIHEAELICAGEEATLEERYKVAISLEPFAAYISRRSTLEMPIGELFTGEDAYVRRENGQKVEYVQDALGSDWKKGVYQEDAYPLVYYYARYGEGAYPDEETVLTQETLAGELYYVLTYTYNGVEYYGRLESEEETELLRKVEITVSYYANAETFVCKKKVKTFKNLDGSLLWILRMNDQDMMYLSDCEVLSYTITTRNMKFGEVEVPEVPEEVLKQFQGDMQPM